MYKIKIIFVFFQLTDSSDIWFWEYNDILVKPLGQMVVEE
jgi:hypothetical protein